MSASNVLVQHDRVTLITDGALCDKEGVLRAVASKVAVAEAFRMAIVGIGRINPREIAAAMLNTCQGDVMRSLPAYLTAQRRWNAKAAPDYEVAGRNDCHLIVALWSDLTDTPEAWIIGSSQAFFGPGYQPFALAEIEQLAMPTIAAGGFDPTRFDPARDGEAVLIEQRNALQRGHRWVGGFGELTTVTRDGVTQKRLCEWPDKVGERIAP